MKSSISQNGNYLVFTGTLYLSSTFLIYVRNGKHKYMVCKNFQGRNPSNIFIAILKKSILHKFILTLTDL